MKRLSLIAVTIGIFSFIPLIYACEPCEEELGFEETAKKADLIIIGQKVSESPDTNPSGGGPSGPDCIELKAFKVLKGNNDENKIRVNSWDAMCDYGIVVDDKTYVMFLVHYEDRDANDKIQSLLEQKQAF